ncbi:hypothetical protein B879_03781 [Cecembia lonarensis LW9]|uniref:Uncharacterized protein n=1 Tax=Cecembia lonarensis (strain CCUG 58316 / KCTC 22772 / LW9) TaxID=1225176 RepID=K1L6A9_CECL9|nr:hypothetical protein B879_03781 [Cecembia lonarensis LW9]
MKEINIQVSLTNENLVTDGNFDRIRCEVKGHLENYVYHILKESQGFIFYNKSHGGLNGYYPTVRELVISAKLHKDCKILLID